jgi:hypothetical protein
MTALEDIARLERQLRNVEFPKQGLADEWKEWNAECQKRDAQCAELEQAIDREECKVLFSIRRKQRLARKLKQQDAEWAQPAKEKRQVLAGIRRRQRSMVWWLARQAAEGIITEREYFHDCRKHPSHAKAVLKAVGGAKPNTREKLAFRAKREPQATPDVIQEELQRINARARAKDLAHRKFEYRLFKDIEANPTKVWLVEDLLGAGEFSIWFGPKGSGKSVILGDAACYIASDKEDWCGRRIKHGAVLYVAAERRAVVERRFAAWRKYHGIDNIPLAVIGGVFDLRSSKADAEAIIETARKLAAETGVEVVLIIIDTAAQVLAGGDENTKDLAAVASNVALIQDGTKAHVALVHHVPHYAPERPRGHGSLPNASDVTIRVGRHANHRLAEIYQVNDGPEDTKIQFTLIGVELGTNPDTGKLTKAPVVVPIDGDTAQPAAKAKAGPKLPIAATLALKALREAVDEVGTPPPASNHIPAGVKVVTADLWREYAYKRSVSPADTPEARKKAFKRASDKLLELGRIAVWDKHVWLVGDK